MTINKAIREAIKAIRMVNVGCKSWSIEQFDADRNLWVVGSSRDYFSCRASLTERRMAMVLMLLGQDSDDAEVLTHRFNYGPLSYRIGSAIKVAR